MQVRRFSFVFLGGFVLLQTVLLSPAHAELNQRQLNTLQNEVMPAYWRGNTLELLKTLSKLTQKMSDEKVVELDDELAQHGAPPAADILVSARLSLLRQQTSKQRSKLPRPKLREMVITLDAIQQDLAEVTDEAASHEVMHLPLPKPESIEDYEPVFWEAHVLEQRLQNAADLARYAVELTKNPPRMKTDKLSQEHQAVLKTDFAKLVSNIEALQSEIAKQEFDLRVQRIRLAASTLDSSSDIRDRLFASWAVDVDGGLLLQEFDRRSQTDVTISRDQLDAGDLAEEMRTMISQAREDAGDMLAKSRLLFEGLHWWLRGRYGKGTDGFGLLKSPAAVTSPEARFALYMPKEMPRRKAPAKQDEQDGFEAKYGNSRTADSYVAPEVDRRHLYIWAWEYRQAGRDRKKSSVSSRRNKTTQLTELTHFY